MAQALAETRVDQLPVAPPASESAAILSVIERMAMNPEIDPDRIERFIVLKERIDAANAKKAFDAAVAKAKELIPTVSKNRTGHNNTRYADFAAYAAAVDPVIAPLGLSYRFRTRQDDRIHVCCVLTHEGGHSEENSLSGPPDGSGSKNAIQAIGSTLSYLQRYTLVQALGLAAAHDDDGAAAGADTLSDEQIDEINGLIDQAVDVKPGTDRAAWLTAFLDHMKAESLMAIPAKDFSKAKAAIRATIQREASR